MLMMLFGLLIAEEMIAWLRKDDMGREKGVALDHGATEEGAGGAEEEGETIELAYLAEEFAGIDHSIDANGKETRRLSKSKRRSQNASVKKEKLTENPKLQINLGPDLEVFYDKPAEEIIEKGIELYNQAISGDAEAAGNAYELFKLAREKTAENNLLNAYFAASDILVSKSEKSPVERGKRIYKALDMLDRSVNAEDNSDVRRIRAYTCLNLPGYFNRTSTAVEDLEYLKKQIADQSTEEMALAYKGILSDIEKAQQIKASVPPHIQKMIDGFAERAKKAKSKSL